MPFSSVSVVDFKQVNFIWDINKIVIVSRCFFLLQQLYFALTLHQAAYKGHVNYLKLYRNYHRNFNFIVISS